MLVVICIAILAMLAATAWWASAQYEGRLQEIWGKAAAAEDPAGLNHWNRSALHSGLHPGVITAGNHEEAIH